ncbi:MAG: PilZ domain-containing protein [Desulfocapsaceae bacterium]|jgi:hypothetical protein|nr:PilZ domain-containing protein [Desulfocapsaceae bacterium]
MTDKKMSWDDIPSLDGLKVDREYKAENPLGRRKFERMTAGDMASILEVDSIKARVVTGKHNFDGLLSDICADGMALILKNELSVNQYVKIGFFLGRQKIVSKAVVKRSVPSQDNYNVGFQFQGINEEDSRYIHSLYAAKRLNRL